MATKHTPNRGLDPYSAMETAIACSQDEFARRVQGERDKSVEKYGEEALAPTGHPEYDIFDYAINEIVGLVRYSEMVRARGDLMYRVGCIPFPVCADLRKAAAAIRSFAEEQGPALIRARSRMRDELGLHLGTPERR